MLLHEMLAVRNALSFNCLYVGFLFRVSLFYGVFCVVLWIECGLAHAQSLSYVVLYYRDTEITTDTDTDTDTEHRTQKRKTAKNRDTDTHAETEAEAAIVCE